GVAASLALAAAAIADDRTFTQEPAVAPAVVRGGAVSATPDLTPKNLFDKGPAPVWIWGADVDTRYFLRTEFVGGSTAARLKATCDNEMTIFINGKEVVTSTTWEQPVEVDVQKYLK